MNQKDKNLVKGLGLLVACCIAVCVAGLKIFGDPLRLVGGLGNYLTLTTR